MSGSFGSPSIELRILITSKAGRPGISANDWLTSSPYGEVPVTIPPSKQKPVSVGIVVLFLNPPVALFRLGASKIV